MLMPTPFMVNERLGGSPLLSRSGTFYTDMPYKEYLAPCDGTDPIWWEKIRYLEVAYILFQEALGDSTYRVYSSHSSITHIV